MNTVTADIKVIDNNDQSILFQNKYTFTNLMKKDGTPNLTNQNKMEKDLKKTRDMLNDQYVLASNPSEPKNRYPIEGRKLICNFNIVN